MASILLDINADVKVIKTQMVALIEEKRDHEHRLRKLERFRNTWPSAALLGTFAAVAAVILTVVGH